MDLEPPAILPPPTNTTKASSDLNTTSQTSGDPKDGGNPDNSTEDRRTPTPDRVKCAICLGDLVNKSYSNTCIHQFCFGCLLEWSKVKPECPLCKSTFRSIYHNIRSISDYDEYVVPVTIPQLSIRVSSSDRSPELLITSGGNHHDYSLPGYYHRAEAMMRERMMRRDPNRVFRFQYQFSPYGATSSSDLSVLFRGAVPPFPFQQENPFMSTDQPEFFGAALDLASNNSASAFPPNGFSGYQGRRRIYDRDQWVTPFESTLAPGTVFFPSVEYIQRHPAAFRRISTWLHRELTVLLSLNHTRSQMGFVFDLIVSILHRHDIRSSEFRESLRQHIGSKTRHFQHEFYYFLLSGMGVEEYDRVVRYTPASSTTTSSTRTSSHNRILRNAQPAIVTLDSDDDHDIVEVVDIIDDDDNNPLTNSRRNSVEQLDENSRRTNSPVAGLLSRIPDSPNRHDSMFPIDLPDSLDGFEQGLDPDVLLNDVTLDGLLRNHETHEANRDPEMPVLEPQVDLNNLSSRTGADGSTVSSAFRRLTKPPSLSRALTSTLDSIRNRSSNSGLSEPDYFRTNLYLNPRYDDSDETSRQSNSSTTQRDPVDGRRSPFPSRFSPEITVNRPLRSPDFPILQLRQNRERRLREESNTNATDNSTTVPSERRHERSSCVFRNPERYLGHNNDYHNQDFDMERSSCIHAPSSSSIQIRIFPHAMDLSTQGRDRHSSSVDPRSNSVIRMRSRSPNRPPSPPRSTNSAAVGGGNEEECEFLGVHPIVKKPPLAVITLSSEDEGTEERPIEAVYNTRTAYPQISPQAGPSSYQYYLPPIKRHHNYSTASVFSNLDSALALSSLPSENLIERHIGELSNALSNYAGGSSLASNVLPSPSIPTNKSSKRRKSKSAAISKISLSAGHTRTKNTRSKSKAKESIVEEARVLELSTSPILIESRRRKPRPISRSSSSETDSQKEEEQEEYKRKLTKKKKSKKVKKSKSKSPSKDKKEKVTEEKIKRKRKTGKISTSTINLFSPSHTICNSAHSSNAIASSSTRQSTSVSSTSSNSRLKSVVVKVNKPPTSSTTIVKPPKKRKPAKLLSSSSEDDNEDETNDKTVVPTFPISRLGSVIAESTLNFNAPSSSSHSNTTTTTESKRSLTGSRSSDGLDTPFVLDLSRHNGSSPSPYLMSTASASVSFSRSSKSRRWESDDDDELQNQGNQVSGSESLLSLDNHHRGMDLDDGSRSSSISVGGNARCTDSDNSSCGFRGQKNKRQRLNIDDF